MNPDENINEPDSAPSVGAGKNRLAEEKSPYLEQHATNPVDWHPWGSEAFQKARKEDRPLFISIGYSTCRWCHVIERESFENPELAQFLNAHFVPVKVDREERPDVDRIYLTACRAFTGTAGWPLTVMATPDGEPFFAATYLPPESRRGRPGLKEVLFRIVRLWDTDRQELHDAGEQMARAIRERRPRAGGKVARPRRCAQRRAAAPRVSVCVNKLCRNPTHDPGELTDLLDR